MGIRIDGGSEHINVNGVTSRDMWGDGFYVEHAKDVSFCSVTADHNRRQGLSVIEANGLLVTQSIFKNTDGTHPSSRIDLEPDRASQLIRNVRIRQSQFLDNTGAGLLIDAGKGPISDIEIDRNVFDGNPRAIKLKHAPEISMKCGNQIANSGVWSDFFGFVETVEFKISSNSCKNSILEVKADPSSEAPIQQASEP